jgi:hypothetical protein
VHEQASIDRELASTLFYLGHFEQVIQEASRTARYRGNITSRRRKARLFTNDPHISCAGYEALANWFLGQQHVSVLGAQQAASDAAELGHDHTHVVAVLIEAMVKQFCGDAAAVNEAASRLVQISSSHGLFQWTLAGEILGDWSKAALGLLQPAEACFHMKHQIVAWHEAGAQLFTPYWYWNLGAAARGQALAGVRRDAVEAGLTCARATGEQWWSAELTRLKAINNPSHANELLRHSIEMAKAQRSPALELRASLDLAALMMFRENRTDIIQLLEHGVAACRPHALEDYSSVEDVVLADEVMALALSPSGSSANGTSDYSRRLGNSALPRLILAPPV